MTNYIKRKKGLNCTNRVLAAGLSDLQRAEATVEFMNLFRQMLNEARFFSHDERSLRGYLIEDIEKKKLKAEELLNIESTNVKTKNKHLNKHEKKTKNK